MKEVSLVVFTILSQSAVGVFLTWLAVGWMGPGWADRLTVSILLAVDLTMLMGLTASFFHLGAPSSAWRACANWRSSWLSREILFALLFAGSGGLLTGLHWLDLGTWTIWSVIAWFAALMGVLLTVSMANAYRLRTIPAWNTWATLISFLVTSLLLGGLGVGVILDFHTDAWPDMLRSVIGWIALSSVGLLGLQLTIVLLWVAGLAGGSQAAVSSVARVTRIYGVVFKLRLVLAVMGGVILAAILAGWMDGQTKFAFVLAFGLVFISEVLGRWLFYEAGQRHGV